MSDAAPAGTWSVALKVHDSPARRLPPENLKRVFPTNPTSDDPVPQISAGGRPVAARPGIILARLSSKKIAVASETGLMLSIVNWSVTGPPGKAGSSVNSLVRTRPAMTGWESNRGC